MGHDGRSRERILRIEILLRGDTMTEAQKKAKAKYEQKCNHQTICFYPNDTDIWEYLNAQSQKQTFIKDLIRKEMQNGKF